MRKSLFYFIANTISLAVALIVIGSLGTFQDLQGGFQVLDVQHLIMIASVVELVSLIHVAYDSYAVSKANGGKVRGQKALDIVAAVITVVTIFVTWLVVVTSNKEDKTAAPLLYLISFVVGLVVMELSNLLISKKNNKLASALIAVSFLSIVSSVFFQIQSENFLDYWYVAVIVYGITIVAAIAFSAVCAGTAKRNIFYYLCANTVSFIASAIVTGNAAGDRLPGIGDKWMVTILLAVIEVVLIVLAYISSIKYASNKKEEKASAIEKPFEVVTLVLTVLSVFVGWLSVSVILKGGNSFEFPIYYSIFALVGIVAVVVASKLLLKKDLLLGIGVIVTGVLFLFAGLIQQAVLNVSFSEYWWSLFICIGVPLVVLGIFAITSSLVKTAKKNG